MTTGTYTVETKGLEEMIALLDRFPEISQSEMRKAMVASVLQLQNDVKEFTPVGVSETLQSKIGHEIEPAGGSMIPAGSGVAPIGGVGMITGRVHSGGVPYALVRELGRRPGGFPPRSPIERWCHLVLGDAQAWYLVARKIAQRGYKGAFMFARAWMKDKEWINAQFVRARDRIVERLSQIGINVRFG
jgi:hypothetical protein